MTQINSHNLKAGRIFLRQLRKTDAQQMFDAFLLSRNELRPWMWWEAITHKPEDLEKYICRAQMKRKEGTQFDFGIFDIGTGEYLGNAGIGGINYDHGYGELGYWVRSDRHRCGIALTTSVTLLRFGFEDLKLHKIKVRANINNAPSLSLIKKLGFVKEGISRDDLKVEGKYGDHLYAGMLENEYFQLVPTFDKWVPRNPD